MNTVCGQAKARIGDDFERVGTVANHAIDGSAERFGPLTLPKRVKATAWLFSGIDTEVVIGGHDDADARRRGPVRVSNRCAANAERPNAPVRPARVRVQVLPPLT